MSRKCLRRALERYSVEVREFVPFARSARPTPTISCRAKLFVAGPRALACRWKIHEFGLGQRRLSALTSTSTSTSSTTTPSDTILAEFFPPNVGVLKPSLTLYSPSAAEAADDIVLTALLAAAGRDDWRSTQNQSPPIEEVRQSLSAGLGAGESFATLPPYTSTTDLPSY